jgi:hypothetical protein
MRKAGAEALIWAGIVVLLTVTAALGGRAHFGVTLLYVACTVLVVACATSVTICGAVRLGKGQPGRRDRPGFVEIGFLIGLFAVSPMALSGAFVLLDALVGVR